MDKIKKGRYPDHRVKHRYRLQWRIVLYLLPFLLAAYAGAMTIGIGTNELQTWFDHTYSEHQSNGMEGYEIVFDSQGVMHYSFFEKGDYDLKSWYGFWYSVISYAQVVLTPLWVIMCLFAGGMIFYRRELKKPFAILMQASEKIAQNQLDFNVAYEKPGELGALCAAFEKMRAALYESNQNTWRLLEERKRLNAAFSHDLRTPLTVLRGYTDFLEKYVSSGNISHDKQMEILGMMDRQVVRLQGYVEKMNAAQKLEDAEPVRQLIKCSELEGELRETGELLCQGKRFSFALKETEKEEKIFIDPSLVMEVYENLVSNGVRYAENEIDVSCQVKGGFFEIKVKDDGKGFSEEAFLNAPDPFFHDKKESGQEHFGMGLYICRIICEKCGGGLVLENESKGAAVTAKFSIQ